MLPKRKEEFDIEKRVKGWRKKKADMRRELPAEKSEAESGMELPAEKSEAESGADEIAGEITGEIAGEPGIANEESGMPTLLLTDAGTHIKLAAEILKEGGLVAFPTETVYGLGADALNPDAVGKVYAAKGRPSDNPMIVHIAFVEDLKKLTPEITPDMEVLAREFWPGPLTMVVPALDIIPRVTTGGLDTVGVRLPSNHVARILISEAGCPVAAPSANISGRPSPTSAKHVIQDLKGRIDGIIISDDADYGLESTVVDMTGDVPMILRPGVITREMLEDALEGPVEIDPALKSETKEPSPCSEFKPKAPGMKYKHYAPKAEMTVFMGDRDKARAIMKERAEALKARGKKVKSLDFSIEPEGTLPDKEEKAIAAPEGKSVRLALMETALGEQEARRAAKELFRELRAADEEGVDEILALAIPAEGIGFAVMNRMLKSAGYNIVEV